MIDLVILTAKAEELAAVCAQFPDPCRSPPVGPFRRVYEFRQTKCDQDIVRIAITRCSQQGNTESQTAARAAIDDLSPRLIAFVGIAGAVPSTDVFLGDVLIATEVHDFDRAAQLPQGQEQALTGHRLVASLGDFVSMLPAILPRWGTWVGNIGVPRPKAPAVRPTSFTAPDQTQWNQKIRESLKRGHSRNTPEVRDGPIASSSDLMKDPAGFANNRLVADRRILGTDMESAGICVACERGGESRSPHMRTPFISVRSISDIVGLKRDEAWTRYAIATAAAFFRALIENIPLREMLGDQGIPSGGGAPEPSQIRRWLSLAPRGVPESVLAILVNSELPRLEEVITSSVLAAGLVRENGWVRLQVAIDPLPRPSVPSEVAAEALNELLLSINAGVDAEPVTGSCRLALTLFGLLDPATRRRMAHPFLDTLDGPSKTLGDKRLVLAIGEACITASSHLGHRLSDEAECEARALICMTSWYYQRTGRLDRALEDAKKSESLSVAYHLTKNLAFCKKCIGRIYRMQGEIATAQDEKSVLFGKSVASLLDAIERFSKDDRMGPHSVQVGDSYSLLARTRISMRDYVGAKEYVRKASSILRPADGKYFVDFQLVRAEILMATGDPTEAAALLNQLIDDPLWSKDPSEIRARCYAARANFYERHSNPEGAALDFDKAAHVWSMLGESDKVADARWASICLKNKLPRDVLKEAAKYPTSARVIAYERISAAAKEKSAGVLSRRVGQDGVVWERELRRAAKDASQSKVVELRSAD